MYELQQTSAFHRDLKRISKRGYNRTLLRNVIKSLQNGEMLDKKYRDHPLRGDYEGFRECHIQNDWILIYMVNVNTKIIILARTGTHSDLFK
jgi:mRNA interferase YafQ